MPSDSTNSSDPNHDHDELLHLVESHLGLSRFQISNLTILGINKLVKSTGCIKHILILTPNHLPIRESFQDFEADFPWKVSLKMLN